MTEAFPSVEPHGSLEPIIDDVWYLTGSVVFKPLIRLPRNMVVVRHGEELTVINSVRLNAEGEAALNALGKVSHVIKIGFHGMDDAYYVDRYGAKMWNIEDGSLSEGGELPFPGAQVFMFRDVITPEAAILIEREGGLLITCDSIQHWVPKEVMSLVGNIVCGILGFKKPAQIGPKWREVQTPENGSLKPDFERLVALPFERIIGGHGGLLESNGPGTLQASIDREL